MVSDKYNSTTFGTNNNRWIPKEELQEKRTNGWIEVVSKHSKRHSTNVNDPFAGMKSCVDYEQEIERLKQLVPKVTPITKSNKLQGISRSTSPDTTHSSDSDISLPEPQSVISKEERARFLAFVRSWTGDLKGGYGHHEDELMNNNSLWADQSPWTTPPQKQSNLSYCNNTASNSIYNHNYNHNITAVQPRINNDYYYSPTVQNQSSLPYYNNTTITSTNTTSTINHWEHYQPSYSMTNRRPSQQPIGMGRSSFSSTSSVSSLKGRTNSPFVL